ncbi:hypothetical protein OBBRIDRAFT_439503 [Obba rivulosa]|uniref:Uncharacterized protein n=1 Tax=Obba rivulosa TaxID=1052685 RepID=A0A8E2DEN2_9APHY|nr:hypothetical protein OBBRIDRAFT_439503 [Obba rivulosa]
MTRVRCLVCCKKGTFLKMKICRWVLYDVDCTCIVNHIPCFGRGKVATPSVEALLVSWNKYFAVILHLSLIMMSVLPQSVSFLHSLLECLLYPGMY